MSSARSRMALALLLACTFAVILQCWFLPARALTAAGPEQNVIWSSPERLSAPGSVIQQATVAADPWGGVHVLWIQNAEGDVTLSSRRNLIYYTYWDGLGWSSPHDVLAGASYVDFSYLSAFADDTGRLHLVWSSSAGLYYSSAPVLSATDARAWQLARLLTTQPYLGPPRLTVDADERMHLVYSVSQPGGNVWYMGSANGGFTWTDPTCVSAIAPDDPHAPAEARLAEDNEGRLHVAWYESYPPDWLGRQVLYSSSSDLGKSWSSPLALSDISTGVLWNSNISIVSDSSDGLHAVWVCGRVSRCYRFSVDGGLTWSVSQQVFGELMGVSGWDAMVADQYGEAFWIGALREPQSVYFAQWSAGKGWHMPITQLVTPAEHGALGAAHFFSLSIAQGNRLHLVMVASDKGEVWYISGTTGQPELPAPTPRVVPASTQAQPSPTAPRTPRQEATAIPAKPPRVNGSGGGSTAVLVGVAPVVLLVAAILIARSRARGR